MSDSEGIQNLFGEFNEVFEEEQVTLNEREFLFANLMYKTDFTPEEIEDVLEWEPNDEEMGRIREKVSNWRSPDNQKNVLLL